MPEELQQMLNAAAADPGWLSDARDRVAADPAAIGGLFPAVSRRCGRAPLEDPQPAFAGWTVDDAARTLLLTAVDLHGEPLAAEARSLYTYGDAAEKRGVLRALAWLDIGDAGTGLLHDAIRTNDPRLVAAALGPYARHLDDAMWRQAVLKCVFMEIPLTAVAGLVERADGTLAQMLADLADERHAAGRTMPADATALLAQLTDRQEAN
jgi:hypothetical protein